MAKDNNILDPDMSQAWQDWSTDRSTEANARVLRTLDPVIDQAVRVHTGTSNPLIKSRARMMALKALSTYDPKRGRLKSHLFSQLQGLKRQHAVQSHIMRAPERLMLERRGLTAASRELESELGREPTDSELATRSGLSLKKIARIRQYSPAMSEGFFAGLGEAGGFMPAVRSPAAGAQSVWTRIVYDELGPIDQKIFEWSLGWNNQPTLSNQQIAAKLGLSPGAVSQRKALIQRKLDEEQEFSLI